MKIFISWSGHRSQVVAEALREWLVRVIQRLDPWVSSEDIRVGARWQTEIAGVLSHTKVGILCLTPDNLDSRWLNFEAGALAKTIDNATFVCPYLIGLEPASVPLPLGQFQSKKADKEGTKALVRTVNDAMGEAALAEARLDDAFEMYWPRLKEVLDNLPEPESQAPPRRDSADVLEEILDIVRGLARQRYDEDYYDYPDSGPINPEAQGQVIDLMEALKASLADRPQKGDKKIAPNKSASPDPDRPSRGRRR